MTSSTKKLGEVCDVVGGGTPKTGVSKYWNGDLCWITPKDLGKMDTVEISNTERKITEDGLKSSSAQKLPIGSVILSSRAPIGYVAINTVPMATNQGCRSFVCGPDIFNKYLYYFLVSNTELLNSLGSGSTFLEVAGSRLKEIEIPLPPLITQKQIVAILDEKFAKLREAQRLREEVLVDTEKILSQTLKEIFEEGRKKGWEEKTLPEISENIDSMRKPITKSDREQGVYPYYGASGIVDYVEDFIFDEELLLISEDGANLIARSTPIAFTANGKFWVNNHAHVIRFQNNILQEIVKYYLNLIDLKPYITGSAQPKLNQANLNRIKILIPPLSEQQKIVDRLDILSEKIKTLRELQKSQLEDMKKLEKAYLREAFSGELI